jgi:D-amino-acid dehydrogenase
MAETVVVGGGAIGVAVAHSIARKQGEVTLVERATELGSGCSFGSAGLVCPSHAAPLASPDAWRQGISWVLRRESPLYVRPDPRLLPWLARFAAASTRKKARIGTDAIRLLGERSLDLHYELAQGDPSTGFERRGILNVYETEDGFTKGCSEALAYRDAGLRAEIVRGPGVRELEPVLADSLAGAIYYPDEGFVEPFRFVQALGERAVAHGARIRTGVEVIGFRVRNGRIQRITTTSGDETVGEVVLAAGSWTGKLARMLGLALPLEAGKGYHVEIESPSEGPRLPIFMQEARVIATPFPGRLRLSGTLELAGLNSRINPLRVKSLTEAGQRTLTNFGRPAVRSVWQGFRPCAPDGLPIIGRSHRYDNLVIATGHAMLGITLAPITGELVAETIHRESKTFDIDRFSPERFRSFLSFRLRSQNTR